MSFASFSVNLQSLLESQGNSHLLKSFSSGTGGKLRMIRERERKIRTKRKTAESKWNR